MAVKIKGVKAVKEASIDTPAEKGLKESDKALAGLQKTHGDNIGARGGGFKRVARVMSGIFPMDLAIGGGFPESKCCFVYGKESSGKTMVLYKLIIEVQRRGQTAVLIDIENSHDPVWATMLGVDCKKLIVIIPDNAQQTVDAVEAMVHADDVGIVGLDSLAMMVTMNELEKGADVAAVGGASALIGKMYRKVGSGLSVQRKRGRNTMFVAINQIRHKIGDRYGDPEVMPGGNMPMFVSSLTVRLYGKKEIIKEVNPDLAAILDVNGTVRKWKVPIVGQAFTYRMALLPHDGMALGDVDSWATVANRLKSQGGLSKGPNGWLCAGDQYKALDAIKAEYMDDLKFRKKLQQLVVDGSEMIGSQKPPELKKKVEDDETPL